MLERSSPCPSSSKHSTGLFSEDDRTLPVQPGTFWRNCQEIHVSLFLSAEIAKHRLCLSGYLVAWSVPSGQKHQPNQKWYSLTIYRSTRLPVITVRLPNLCTNGDDACHRNKRLFGCLMDLIYQIISPTSSRIAVHWTTKKWRYNQWEMLWWNKQQICKNPSIVENNWKPNGR